MYNSTTFILTQYQNHVFFRFNLNRCQNLVVEPEPGDGCGDPGGLEAKGRPVIAWVFVEDNGFGDSPFGGGS